MRLTIQVLLAGVIGAGGVAACGGATEAPDPFVPQPAGGEAYAFRWTGRPVDGELAELEVEGVYDPERRSGTSEARHEDDEVLFYRQRISEGRVYLLITPDSTLGPALGFGDDACVGKSWMHVWLWDVNEFGDLLDGAMRPDPELLTAALAEDPGGFIKEGDEAIEGVAAHRYGARPEYLREEGRRLVVTDEVGEDADAFLASLTLWIDDDGLLRRASWTGGGDLSEEYGTLDITQYGVPPPLTEPPPPESTCRYSGFPQD